MKKQKQNNVEESRLVLIPQAFLSEIHETQTKILNILSEDKEKEAAIGDYISEAEAIKLLGRKTTWFWNIRNSGKLPYTKIGNKVYYSKNDIVKILEQNRKGGDNE